MTKRLSLLNGLAILAVVCHHATSWGYVAMFWWADSYRPVTAPNFDQLGGLAYFSLVTIQELALFSVPAFLFVSGFFVAFAARSGPLTWKVIRSRITRLLWPYLLWTLVTFGFNAAKGQVHSVGEYVRDLLTGGAIGAFYFVPTICQFYLLSPWLVRWSRQRPRQVLYAAGALHLAVSAVFLYLQVYAPEQLPSVYGNGWLFIWHPLYFPLGIVAGLQWNAFQTWIMRYKRVFFIAAAVLGVATILENEWLRAVMHKTPEWQALTFSSTLYALAFIFAFLAFEGQTKRSSQSLNWLGPRSFGIFLIHQPLLEVIARLLHHFVPILLSQQVLFVLVIAAIDIAIIGGFMELMARSPLRRVYRYVFG